MFTNGLTKDQCIRYIEYDVILVITTKLYMKFLLLYVKLFRKGINSDNPKLQIVGKRTLNNSEVSR